MYTITCTHGEGKFKQTVSRSFRLALSVKMVVNTATMNNFDCSNPVTELGPVSNIHLVYSVHCGTPWGVINYNDQPQCPMHSCPYGLPSTYDGEMLW